MIETNVVHVTDARDLSMLPDSSVHCVITSPPYYSQRQYAAGEGEIGIDASLGEYVESLVCVFREVRRVLRRDGVCWLNIGDSYSAGGRGTSDHHRTVMGKTAQAQALGRKHTEGFDQKQLLGIPWRVALSLQDDGWYLRADCVWNKLNSMPASVTDRVTISHEYMFMLTKSPHYWYDYVAVLEPLKEVSIKRQMRGRGTTKYTNGDYGQDAHSLAQPKAHRGGYADMDDLLQTGELGLHPGGRNKRSVWTVATSPSCYDFCGSCSALYIGKERKALREIETNEQGEKAMKMLPCPKCGEMSWFAHFAPYPRALIEPALLSSCPPFVCAACATPYTRTTEKQSRRYHESPNGANDGANNREPYKDNNPHRARLATKHDQATGRTSGSYADPLHEKAVREITTMGWRKACECDCADTLPGIVLDPFMGSGTTAMTAELHTRRWIGVDLNPHCRKLTMARISRLNDDPQFRAKTERVSPPPKVSKEQMSLF